MNKILRQGNISIMNDSKKRIKFSPKLLNGNSIDTILEDEKQYNKKDCWNKLDKTIKMQKLSSFAHKYGLEYKYESLIITSLIAFLSECLEKNKFQKKNDLVYDKETYEIVSIPSLLFHGGCFSLKVTDSKRVSTLKSLTPKRKEVFDDKIEELLRK